MFQSIDTEKQGFIRLDQFRCLLEERHIKSQKGDVELLFSCYDIDRDAVVSLTEFKSLVGAGRPSYEDHRASFDLGRTYY